MPVNTMDKSAGLYRNRAFTTSRIRRNPVFGASGVQEQASQVP